MQRLFQELDLRRRMSKESPEEPCLGIVRYVPESVAQFAIELLGEPALGKIVGNKAHQMIAEPRFVFGGVKFRREELRRFEEWLHQAARNSRGDHRANTLMPARRTRVFASAAFMILVEATASTADFQTRRGEPCRVTRGLSCQPNSRPSSS